MAHPLMDYIIEYHQCGFHERLYNVGAPTNKGKKQRTRRTYN